MVNWAIIIHLYKEKRNQPFMNFANYFSKQARKPKGLFGRFYMSRVFDKGNARLNALVYQTMDMKNHEQALEIGFGTGTQIHSLARNVDTGHVQGIDFSETMAGIARKKNRAHIKQGKVTLTVGNFDTAEYDPNTFDCIFSVNTIYFWKAPEHTLDRVHHFLKPGGRLVLGFHELKDLEKMNLDPKVFTHYSPEKITRLLSEKFTRVKIITDSDSPPPVRYAGIAVK